MEPTPKLLEVFGNGRMVTTDSRQIRGGEIFFALKGPNFNGNAYATGALEAGAAHVVVDEEEFFVAEDDRYVLVEDCLLALQALARNYRKRFEIPFIGLTGSNGKTTTKELLVAALSRKFKVHATAGNLNNHIGVPLTLLSMPADTEIAVIEMGANRPNDIGELAAIALPTHVIITNIGEAHLELFKSIDGVMETKGELFDFARENGSTAWVNELDERVVKVSEGITDVITIGKESSDYYISESDYGLSGSTIRIGDTTIESQLVGAHNGSNVLAAFAIAATMGVEPAEIAAGIAAYEPRNNRSQWVKIGDCDVFLDAYNANPSSMRAAIEFISTNPAKPVTLILGDMFELGDVAIKMHEEIGELINRYDVQEFIGVGELMKSAVDKCVKPTQWYATAQEAKAYAQEVFAKPGIVLIKGSRGMALEKLLEVS